MKITLEDIGHKVMVETNEVEFSEIMEYVKGAFMAIGFHPKTVEDYFNQSDEQEVV